MKHNESIVLYKDGRMLREGREPHSSDYFVEEDCIYMHQAPDLVAKYMAFKFFDGFLAEVLVKSDVATDSSNRLRDDETKHFVLFMQPLTQEELIKTVFPMPAPQPVPDLHPRLTETPLDCVGVFICRSCKRTKIHSENYLPNIGCECGSSYTFNGWARLWSNQYPD